MPPTSGIAQPQTEAWRAPPENVVKVNCDGAFNGENMTGATGAVLRHSDGSFIRRHHVGLRQQHHL